MTLALLTACSGGNNLGSGSGSGGCADSFVELAFTTLGDVLDYILIHEETSKNNRDVGIR